MKMVMVKQKCYDSERVMYISSSSLSQDKTHDNPDSFFKITDSHLNRCENNIYNPDTNILFLMLKINCAQIMKI